MEHGRAGQGRAGQDCAKHVTEADHLPHAPGVVSVAQPELISLSSESPHRLHHVITASAAIQAICSTKLCFDMCGTCRMLYLFIAAPCLSHVEAAGRFANEASGAHQRRHGDHDVIMLYLVHICTVYPPDLQ